MNKVITRGKFFSQFLEEEKEILVLTETGTQGAAKYDDMWVPSNHPLAFIDLADSSPRLLPGRSLLSIFRFHSTI